MASYQLHLCDTVPPENSPNYPGLHPGSQLLKAGHQKTPGRAPFFVETIWDRDIEIPMRDEIKLRADIFRPASSSHGQKVPGLVAYSPYGKNSTGMLSIDIMPGRVGVLVERLSGYESFEAPDPAEWTAKGYAVCNVDARGCFDSEGDLRYWGEGEGQDGHDTIEYLASMPWCNGSIALVGNSWLAITQWFIAAQKPPHLTCIAPFEGQSDMYRETLCRGGIPATPFMKRISAGMFGRHKQEDVDKMLATYPLWNAYWEDKRAPLHQIDTPAFILGSYSTGLHTEGAFRAYEGLRGPKWFRVHATQEWYELYRKDTSEELQMFLDRYTKNIDNGWEETPKVRVSILRFNEKPIENHVFPDFPVPDTRYWTLYLNKDGSLSDSKPTDAGAVSYISDAPARQEDNDEEELIFRHVFSAPCTLVGYPNATLYVSCDDHDDMDVFVIIRKMDKHGRILQNINIPLEDLKIPEERVPNFTFLKYLGPSGMLRASHRELDPRLSRPHRPVLAHRNLQKVSPGTVVRLDIPLWPCGMAFREGESLALKVSGHEMRLAELPGLHGTFTSGNKGLHKLYCGAEGHFSSVLLPVVHISP